MGQGCFGQVWKILPHSLSTGSTGETRRNLKWGRWGRGLVTLTIRSSALSMSRTADLKGKPVLWILTCAFFTMEHMLTICIGTKALFGDKDELLDDGTVELRHNLRWENFACVRNAKRNVFLRTHIVNAVVRIFVRTAACGGQMDEIAVFMRRWRLKRRRGVLIRSRHNLATMVVKRRRCGGMFVVGCCLRLELDGQSVPVRQVTFYFLGIHWKSWDFLKHASYCVGHSGIVELTH